MRIPAIGEFFESFEDGSLRIDQIIDYRHGQFRVLAEDGKTYEIVWNDEDGWMTL